MMGHEGADDRPRLPSRKAGGGVVHRLVISVPGENPLRGEAFEIEIGIPGGYHEGKGRGIGCDDEIVGQTALDAETGHAEGPVLIVEMGVDGIVAAFGDSPGDLPFCPVFPLTVHRAPVAFVQEGVFVGGHHQQGHEILEHGAAPGEESGAAVHHRKLPPKGEPVCLGYLPP